MKLSHLILLGLVAGMTSCSKSDKDLDASEDPAGIEVVDSEESGLEDELEAGSSDSDKVADTESSELDDEFSDELNSTSESSDDSLLADSGSESAPSEVAATGTDALAADSEFQSEDLTANAFSAEEPGSSVAASGGAGSSIGTEPPVSESSASMTSHEVQPAVTSSSSVGPGDATYTVQSNETLMLIAFKLYGDYTRWKELAQLNQDTLSGGTNISSGMTIRYNSAGSGFNWSPQGNPYLIQRGDTLGLISDKVYGTLSKWRKIWENNRPLIKDPNKIYVGFTIYYVPEEGRDVAASSAASKIEKVAEPAAAPTAEATAEQASSSSESVDNMANDFPEDI